MSFIRGLISAFIAILAVLFALANRQKVDLSWSPFHEPVSLPLFAVGLGGLLIGFVAGALILWLGSVGVRLEARRQRRKLAATEKQHAQALKAARAAPASGSYVTVPALPANFVDED